MFPPALSDAGNMYFGCKSDLMTCLETVCPAVDAAPSVDGMIIDGAVVVNMLRPGAARTFDDYATQIFIPYIRSQLYGVKRIDVVWDRYESASLKCLTRIKRGSGVRRQVTSSAPVPRNWHDFLRSDDNKTGLFSFLAQKLSETELPLSKHVIVTLDTDVLSSDTNYNTSGLSPCTHEEADTRILLHVADCVRAGHERVIVRTVDTDVVVLCIAFQQKTSCKELWVAFGTGKHFRYIPAHEIAAALGPDRACGLPTFHAFTGCDTVSAFVGHGKKTFWMFGRSIPRLHMPLSSCLLSLMPSLMAVVTF